MVHGDQQQWPPSTDGQTIKSLETTFTIVTALQERNGARITELAKITGLSKSSVHKHLATLRHNGFVIKEDETYRLGMRFLDIGAHVRDQIPGGNIIRENVTQLAADTEETAQFAVLEQGRAVIVFREAGSRGVFTKGRVGKRFYAHQTSAGKAILAQMSEDAIRRIVDDQGLPTLTSETISTLDELLAELEEIRQRGFALNYDESTIGLRSVGVPLQLPDGSTLGAFAVAGPSSRLQGDRLEEELPELIQSVVNELELNLAYS